MDKVIPKASETGFGSASMEQNSQKQVNPFKRNAFCGLSNSRDSLAF